MVIIDHHMDVIMAICDRISVLNFGTLLAEGGRRRSEQSGRDFRVFGGG